MTFYWWFSLGLCSGFVPGDAQLTHQLCIAQYEAEHRQIVVPGPSDAEREQFLIEVSKVVHPKPKGK